MIVAAVPLKRLTRVKSRLAHVLTVAERSELMLRLLGRTLDVIRDSQVVDRILLVTPEAGLDVSPGVDVLIDAGTLNDALRSAARWSCRKGASGLLIVPADLPLIQPDDVRHIVEARGDGQGVVLAATQDGGTAALLLTPPDVIAPDFGTGSAERHRRAARVRGVGVSRVMSDTLTFDLDTESDLERYHASMAAACST